MLHFCFSVKHVPFPSITIKGDSKMNPWGFPEKTFNMLSFYGPDVDQDIFQESKELRTRFDFVIEEVVIRMLRDTSQVMASLLL